MSNCRREIIRALGLAGSYLMPQEALYNSVKIMSKPEPTRAEFKMALSEVEGMDLIIGVRNDLDDQPKWRLTDRGKAQFMEG